MPKAIKHIAVFVLVLLMVITGCNRERGDSKIAEILKGQPKIEEALGKTIVNKLPVNTTGFFLFDTTSDAYKKLKASPWGGISSSMFSGAPQQGEIKELIEAAKRVNLDLLDTEVRNKVISQVVVFTAPDKGGKPSVGVACLSQQYDFGANLELLKNELSKEGFKTQDVVLQGGKAFSFDVSLPADKGVKPSSITIIAGANGKLGVLSTAQNIAESVLSSSGESLPAIVKNDLFKSATSDFEKMESSYSFGFVDLTQIVGEDEAAARARAILSEQIGLQALALSAGMEETPYQHVRLVPRKGGEGEQQSALSKISNSSSERIFSLVYGKPLLLLSLDGPTASRIYSQVVAATQGQQVIDPALLTSLKRLAVVVRVAPVGQSFLPLPDVLVALDSEKPENLQNQLEAAITAAAGENPFPGAKWTEKSLADGVKAKSLMSPLGFGVVLANKDGVVLASSTEAEMRNTLSKHPEKELFQAAVDGQSAKTLESETALTLFVNFPAVASLLETMGGVLSVYAPEANKAAGPLQQATIEDLKRSGMLLSSWRAEGDGSVDIRSSYKPITAAPM